MSDAKAQVVNIGSRTSRRFCLSNLCFLLLAIGLTCQPNLAKAFVMETDDQESSSGAQEKPVRDWPDTECGQLMKELQELQNDGLTGKLAWERKMEQLILLGPDAVPELIVALDETPVDDRLMLRSIPFVLRGIGDKRAIPALIRAIPRCLGSDGSDMGYICEDAELLEFLRRHDNSDRDDDTHYSYGRPLNEVFRTLERWTGAKNDWNQLRFVSDRTGTPRQRQLKRKLFHNNALKWAAWWEEHWHEFIDDSKWSEVNLPDFFEDMNLIADLDIGQPLRHESAMSNMLAQSLYDLSSERTFYDLDTGRWAGLPEKYRDHDRDELRDSLPEILEWAKEHGFDLMGTEIEHDDQSKYVLQPINLEAWEIPMTFWQSGNPHTPQSMIDAGRPVEEVLAHYDSERELVDYDDVAVFFYITSEQTAGQLFLGVEVRDTKMIRGEPVQPNIQLRPTHFWKGRRFGLSLLAEVP